MILMLNRPGRTFLVATAISLLVLVFSQCINRSKASSDFRGKEYVGAAKCSKCHKSIHDSYIHTAHNRSSSPASRNTVKGSFDPHAAEFYYRPNVKVVMEQRDSGLFQVAYMDNQERQAVRFDIVIGSGRKAQTYLYWYNDKVYQLPVSYFVPANSWANSPGYPAHQVRFDRNVPIGCFECHSTYIKHKSDEVAGSYVINNFDKNQIIYGVDCERCHGPAAKHVDFHEKNPQETASKYIARYASLTRQQKIDMCAMCHSGIQQTLKSIFAFKPGDTLVNNFFAPAANVDVADLDVHGNQTQLLAVSQCFIKSKTLTCTSCHNVHEKERDNTAVFSQRCMNCHNTPEHSFYNKSASLKAAIINNCIDCHMPAKPSKSITLLSRGQVSPTPDSIRTHFITVYPEETRKFLSVKK
jgi:hypothetical protein